MMKRMFGIMFAMLLTCSMSVLAGLTIELDPQTGTVVKGFDTTASQNVAIYLTSQGEKYTNVNVALELPAGVTMADGVTSGTTTSVIWNREVIWWDAEKDIPDSNEVAVNRNIKNGRLAIAVARNALKAKQDHCLILQSGVRTKLCDIEFNVDINAVDEAISQLIVTTIVNKCQAEGSDVDYDANNFALSFNLLRDTYGFTTNAGAAIVLDEDAAPVAIDATDKNLFTAQVWDVDKAELVATDAVEFTVATASDETAGTVALEGGKIIYTPAENYYGDFTINYTATFTALEDANVDGSINVTVNAVNDAPAIAIETDDLTVNEGEVLTFAMSFYDVDTEWDAFTKTVTLNGNAIVGEWTVGKADTTRIAPVYTFTASEPVSYDAVTHPAKTATATLEVTIVDNNDADSTGTAGTGVTINDIDQATDFGATSIAAVAAPDPAVFGSKLTAELTDLITDGDAEDNAVITYQWYRDGAAVAGETALVLGTPVKKGEAWQIKAVAVVKPYGDDSAAEEIYTSQEIESNVITIANTAPTAENASLFIRKADGVDAIGVAEITMADVDEEDNLTIAIKTQGTKGTAVVEGNTIKYTVTDTTTEFFEGDADVVTFVVNDGTDDSAEATLTVTYRENPPAEITVTTGAPETVTEVEENGEAMRFEIAIQATDSAEVTPFGIKAIDWQADEGLVIDNTMTEGLDTAAATSVVTIRTNGYETLDGADRPASKEFKVKVSVTDMMNVVTTETFTVTVNDVDRKAPADFAIVFDPAEPKTEDALAATVNGTPVDPDGDEIVGYKYNWSVNGEAVEADGNVLAADNFKKGDMVTVIACALTQPYDADVIENDYMVEPATVVITNTVPALALVEDAKLEATEDQEATAYALADFVTVVDPDVEQGIDTLRYEVIPNFGEEVGTLLYDVEAGNVIFTPAPDYNTEGLEALPTFSVTVTDGEATAEAVEVAIAVAAVNDAPTAVVRDVYLQPNQVGQEVTVAFVVAPGPDNESEQQVALESCEYTAPEDGKALLNGYEAVIDDEAKTISFTFSVAEDAEIGAEGKIDFVLKDNGDPEATSETYSFKVILSGTPWYPTAVLPCEDDVEGLMVRIITDDGQTDIVVKEKNEDEMFELTPAMYYNSGFKGFPRNTSGSVEIYHWSAKGGTGDKCGELEGGINVPDYQAPGKAVIEGTDMPNVIMVSAPLASKFTLVVVDEATNSTVATVEQEFVPNGAQMEVAATVTLTGLEAGKIYKATAQGANPMGEYGEQSDEFEINMMDSPATAWPGDGEFYPAQNWMTTIATNSMNVTFKWPVDAKASSYTLRIYDGNGNTVKTVSGLTVNSSQASLAPGNYRWYVETNNGGKSDMMLFTISKVAGSNAVIKGGYGYRNVLILDAENLVYGESYKFDVIYFDADYNQWAYQLFTGEMSGDGQLTLIGDDVEFYGAANYIMIRPTGKGNYQTVLINAEGDK
jgi:hypothetical protein